MFFSKNKAKSDESSKTSDSEVPARKLSKKTRSDSPFTTSRQEAVANYFYYEYGSFETATVHNLINESAVQYLDSFIASLKHKMLPAIVRNITKKKLFKHGINRLR